MNNLSRLALVAAFLGVTGTAAAASTEVVLHSFKGSQHRDGSMPQSDLIADAAGNLYGTTQKGGKRGGSGSGTVFELSPTGDPDVWTETVLYDFKAGSDGDGPVGGLLMDAKGALYGTTENGGTMNDGTVFKLSPPKTAGDNWKEHVLYSFCSAISCADGAHPIAGLTLGKKGVLYGTTQFGGAGAFGPQEGTAFQLTPPSTKGGAWTETVLHNFCDLANCADGFEPNPGRLLRT
ncbi:MAG TPA: choice-of-anchor tandem repeat GloVer-containing protein, partial [Rhizomicrobium sp.]|nr:choice-of-anchor tandem repeat GloVer-containing protein [Rhizomicrobium sp.]